MNTISAANKISASRDSLKKSNSALDGGKSNGALDGGKSNSALRAVEGSGPLDVDPNLPKIAISNYSLGSDSVHSADNEAKLDRSRMGFGYVNGGRSISFIDGQQHTNMSRINALTSKGLVRNARFILILFSPQVPADISYLEKAGADFGVEFQDLLSQYSLNSAGGSNTDIHRHGAAASTVDPDNRLSAHVYNTSRLSIASTSDGDSIKSRQSLGVPDDIDENASPSRISASEEVRKFVYVIEQE